MFYVRESWAKTYSIFLVVSIVVLTFLTAYYLYWLKYVRVNNVEARVTSSRLAGQVLLLDGVIWNGTNDVPSNVILVVDITNEKQERLASVIDTIKDSKLQRRNNPFSLAVIIPPTPVANIRWTISVQTIGGKI